MKKRYALPVFFLTVAFFWLSLLLTIRLRASPEFHDSTPVSYTEVQGIDSLELIHPEENEHDYSSTMYIRYADQPHITITFKNLKSPGTALQQIFVRKGSRLTLQPLIYPKRDGNTTDDTKTLDDTHWRITEMILPAHINRLYTRGIELDIASQDDKHLIKMPQLHVEAEDASVELDVIEISTLDIRSRYNMQSCQEQQFHAYHSGRIKVEENTKIDALFIESIYGHIELENSSAIQTMHLKTTPETSVELDRLDIYPRMRWEPLPTPPLPECQEGAERMAAPPAMKAQ